MDDVQARRAQQYGLCAYAIAYDRVTDGAEGVFDQAVTNGLAAIVAHNWPEELKSKDGKVKSARQLLTVIEERGDPGGSPQVFRVRHDQADEPAGQAFAADAGCDPLFTAVDIATLRGAIGATQEMRHARDIEATSESALTAEHIEALKALDCHPALRVLTDEQRDRDYIRTRDDDLIEQDRAHRYLGAVDPMEIERRASITYTLDYRSESGGEVDQCPVCDNLSLVAAGRDGMLAMVSYGHCVVCSYERRPEIAEASAIDQRIRQLVDRPD